MFDVYAYEKVGQLGSFDQVTLRSGSPRRKALLAFLKPHIEVPEIDERAIQAHFQAVFAQEDFLSQSAKICCEISKAKLADQVESGVLLIAADTIVVHEGKIYNKPVNRQEALAMLTSYLGKTHQVVTSVALKTATGTDVFYVVTDVTFVDPSPAVLALLEAYIDQKQPYDKAGAYGYQELDPRLLAGIQGDPFNIIGLPVAEINHRLFTRA